MNTRIEAVASAITMQAAATSAPAKKAESAAAPAQAPAPAPAAPTPAVKVQMTSVPASVAADDRTTYLQILKSNGGNAGAAHAAIQAMEAKGQNS